MLCELLFGMGLWTNSQWQAGPSDPLQQQGCHLGMRVFDVRPKGNPPRKDVHFRRLKGISPTLETKDCHGRNICVLSPPPCTVF